MDIDVQCTICGSSEASRCARCRSAAYCSLECQQTDWRTHRLLCTKFSEQAQDNYASRPSPTHYLAIFFPMDKKRPSIVWIDTKKDKYEVEPYFHPVQGNVLRGRTSWQNTLNIWFLDPDVTPRNITTNQAIHGTIPTLIGDTWGEFIWKGPVVAVMRKGTGYEPRHSTDITLTAYRDAVDYLGYYRDTIGSMIEPGREDHLSKRVLADRISKVVGVRINCLRDQISRQEPQLVEVAVPKTHPLFNLEGDDPCDIPALFGVDLVAKSYSNNQSNNDETPPADDLQNPLAQLLLMTTSVKGGEWVHSPDYDVTFTREAFFSSVVQNGTLKRTIFIGL
ncbi:Ubiquitin carboxyl-terminal hydrolase 19 [Fusarium oxysporum f. sp. raphani]|uniref:Ubiquitin carboxyl-terminal hydrolase 19 n=1 Tax=Fusarium oxysporum f. sp. raphani TaxID=96318 RepID=A0A8J5P0A4_FUSOX|nr:Ubiquitin carboxyl-terminal hydrolase 19 [Fusarium oxysporum f. sp. raphani]